MPDKLLSPEYGLSNSKLEECNASPFYIYEIRFQT